MSLHRAVFQAEALSDSAAPPFVMAVGTPVVTCLEYGLTVPDKSSNVRYSLTVAFAESIPFRNLSP